VDWIDELERGWKREYPGVDVTALPPLVRLARLAVLIETLQRETVAPFDLTPSDYTVLAALRRVGPPYEASPSALYNVLERSSGGMTKMLKRLEALGLIRRAPDPEDGRGSLVALTKRGLELQERVFHALLARTQELLAPLPARRRKEVDAALRALLELLEAGISRGNA
jgi:DNA-binding MarR family transcriptional regulator